MYVSKIKQRYRKHRKACICQGDLFKDIDIALGCAVKGAKNMKILDSTIPYAVVMSQACDLNKDYTARKDKKKVQNDFLQTILICPAYLSEDFKAGVHIEGFQMDSFSVKRVEKLEKNYEYSRFHFLKGDNNAGIQDLVVDFKHFMTIPRDSVYKYKNALYVTTLNELFREDLSQRFAAYLSRIGLPEIKS